MNAPELALFAARVLCIFTLILVFIGMLNGMFTVVQMAVAVVSMSVVFAAAFKL